MITPFVLGITFPGDKPVPGVSSGIVCPLNDILRVIQTLWMTGLHSIWRYFFNFVFSNNFPLSLKLFILLHPKGVTFSLHLLYPLSLHRLPFLILSLYLVFFSVLPFYTLTYYSLPLHFSSFTPLLFLFLFPLFLIMFVIVCYIGYIWVFLSQRKNPLDADCFVIFIKRSIS